MGVMFLLMFAIVFFLTCGFASVGEPWRNRLMCLGWAFIAAAMLLERAAPLIR